MHTAILIATGVVAAICTYALNVWLRQGPVRASAGLSLAVGLLFHFFPHLFPAYLTQHIPVVFIGSSFIGMVSASVVSSYFLIGASGFIFSLIYLNTSSFFAGYGGGLGTAACISLLLTIGLPVFMKRRKLSNGYLLLRKMVFKKKR